MYTEHRFYQCNRCNMIRLDPDVLVNYNQTNKNNKLSKNNLTLEIRKSSFSSSSQTSIPLFIYQTYFKNI